MIDASRSDSTEKWFILLALSTLWVASYFGILCNSALEHDMIITFNLSNTEFALFTTISFGVAIISSLFTPYVIKKIDIYKTNLLSSICDLAGQIISIVGIICSNLYVMYFGRILIGIGYGIQNVTVYSTINIWFHNNQWLPFAFNTVNSTYEIGVLLSRYCMQPLYNYTNQLYVPFCIGVILAFISTLSGVAMIFIDKSFDTTITNAINLDNDFKQIRNFNIFIWLTIIIIIIGWSALETVGNQFTVPLMTIFNITEWYADILMSAQSMYALSVGQLCAYCISKYGFLSYYLISAMFFMSISMLLLYVYDIDAWSISIYISSDFCAWMVMFLYIIGGQHFFAASFSCLFLVCPLELTSIVNAVSCIGSMTGSTLQSYCFGVIADSNGGSYSFSILMCLCLLLFGLIIAFIVYYLDLVVDGPLHKSPKSDKNGERGDDLMQINDEYAPLI